MTLEPSEYEFVRAHMGRISWQNLAKMMGRSVQTLRACCDPSYQRTYEPRPKPRPINTMRFVNLENEWAQLAKGERERFLLDRLYRAKRPLQTHELGGKGAQAAIRRCRNRLGDGVIKSRCGTGYWLSEAGRAVAAQVLELAA